MAIATPITTRDWSWSTAGLTVGSAVRAWRDRISSLIIEMDVQSLQKERFEAKLDHYDLSALTMNLLSASSQQVARTRELIARHSTADYELLFIKSGQMTIRHCGRTLCAPTGSIVLLDNDRPYHLDMSQSTVTALHIPDYWLRRWIPYPKEVVAQVSPGYCGWGVPLTAMLGAIETQGLAHTFLPRSAIADQIGGQLALLFGNPPSDVTRHKQVLLERVKARIAERFHEVQLAPSDVAADIGISKRYLHTLFAAVATTFGRALLETRLTHAERLLRDRRFASYSIATLAWECGFADASHFARLFGARYGCTPLAYRKSALQKVAMP